jgi:hypothetical protein
MATGDVTWFRQTLLDLGEEIHDLSTDTYKLGLVTSATTPTATTADPRWGAGGTTNFSSNQVGTGTAYTGPITMTSVTWTLVSNVPTFRAANVTVAQDGSGFTNARWGIIYNDTAAGKQALGFVDLGSDRSIQGGALTIDWSGANGDIFTISTP